MKSRIIFVTLLSLLIAVTGFTVYRLFFYSPDSVTQQKAAVSDKHENQKKRPGMRLSNSVDQKDSIWQDPRLKEAVPAEVPVEQLKATAEVENNLNLLVGLYDQGSDDEFLRRLNELIEKNPDVKEYVALKGDYYFNEGNWPEAEKSIRRLLELNPENSFAQTSLAEVLAIQGQHDEAVKTQQNVLQRDPHNLAAMNGLLAVSEMKGDSRFGEEFIKQIAEKDPSNGNAATIYSQLLREEGHNEEADKILRTARLHDPQNPVVAESLAMTEIRNGKYQEAYDLALEASEHFINVEDKRRALNDSWQAASFMKDAAKLEAILKKEKELAPNGDDTIVFHQQELQALKK